MERRDWFALCAVHSDAWLFSVAFFYAARFDLDGRAELFSLLNQHPTLYEVSTGRVPRSKVYKRKLPKQHHAAAQQQVPSAAYAPASAMAVEAHPLSLPQFAGKAHAADQPSVDGRMLLFEDITPALAGRQAELFWPDDGKWYLIEIQEINPGSRKAK